MLATQHHLSARADRALRPAAAFSMRRALVLFKVACYTGAGFLGGFVVGNMLAATFAPSTAPLLSLMFAALGSAVGSVAGGGPAAHAATRSARARRYHGPPPHIRGAI